MRLPWGATVGLATFGVGLIAAAAVYALSKVPIIGDIINGVMSFIGNGLFGKVTKTVVGGRASAYKNQEANMMFSRNESFNAALKRLALILIFEDSFLIRAMESWRIILKFSGA